MPKNNQRKENRRMVPERSSRNQPETETNIQPLYQKNKSIFQQTAIQILRGIIGILETAVVKLEQEPIPEYQESPNFWQYLPVGWGRFLRQLRLFLPSNVSNNLSDTILTGILLLMVILGSSLFWFTKQPTPVTTNIASQKIPITQPTAITSPESVTPTAESQPTSIPTPEITPTESSKPTPELTLTPTPKVTPIESPKATPESKSTVEPIVKLTPEQILIANIANKIKQITISQQHTKSVLVASNFIKSIEPKFRTSDLTIQINDDWYSLEELQQKQLVKAILRQSQDLNFTHLAIIDSQNRLVARNPVVGDEVILYQLPTTFTKNEYNHLILDKSKIHPTSDPKDSVG